MWTQEDAAKMDAAAKEAADNLQDLASELSPEEKQAWARLQGWWQDWYRKAGHKRLARVLLAAKLE